MPGMKCRCTTQLGRVDLEPFNRSYSQPTFFDFLFEKKRLNVPTISRFRKKEMAETCPPVSHLSSTTPSINSMPLSLSVLFSHRPFDAYA